MLPCGGDGTGTGSTGPGRQGGQGCQPAYDVVTPTAAERQRADLAAGAGGTRC